MWCIIEITLGMPRQRTLIPETVVRRVDTCPPGLCFFTALEGERPCRTELLHTARGRVHKKFPTFRIESDVFP